MNAHQIFPKTASYWEHTLSRYQSIKPFKVEGEGLSRCVQAVKSGTYYAFSHAVAAIAVVVQAIVTPILVLVDLCYQITGTARDELSIKGLEGGSDGFFKDPVWTNYLSQLSQATDTLLKDYPKLAAACEEASPSSPEITREAVSFICLTKGRVADHTTQKSRKQYYQELCKQFRQAAKLALKYESNGTNNEEEREALHFLERLNELRYTSIDLNHSLQESLQNDCTDFNGLDQNPDQNYRAMNQSAKPVGSRMVLFDPHLFGNLPYLLHTLNFSGKECRFIRMPCVTKDLKRNHLGQTEKVGIVEEFLLLEKSYRKESKKHVYINLMNRQKGNEKIRCRNIENLDAKQHSAVSVITIDQDSAFYTNGGNFGENSIDTQTFKDHFCHHMFESGTYYWTSKLPMEPFKQCCRDIMEEIHQEYFSSKETLTQDERCRFIEMQHLKVIDAIFNQITPDSVNISCKNCIDRGATQNSLYYAFHKKKLGLPLKEKDIRHINGTNFCPAYHASSRPPKEFYLMRKWNVSMRRLIQAA